VAVGREAPNRRVRWVITLPVGTIRLVSGSARAIERRYFLILDITLRRLTFPQRVYMVVKRR
jgi:hypothetical protein